jgi:hypothetical protein
MRYLEDVQGHPEFQTDVGTVSHGRVERLKAGVAGEQNIAAVDLAVQDYAGFVLRGRDPAFTERLREDVFVDDAPDLGGDAMVARPLMPAINSGASPVISPITLIDWLTGSTRPPSRVSSSCLGVDLLS